VSRTTELVGPARTLADCGLAADGAGCVVFVVGAGGAQCPLLLSGDE
jgi:hypothetical protein